MPHKLGVALQPHLECFRDGVFVGGVQELVLEHHDELVVGHEAHALIQVKTRKVLRYEAQYHLMDVGWSYDSAENQVALRGGTLWHQEISNLHILFAAVNGTAQLGLRKEVPVVLLKVLIIQMYLHLDAVGQDEVSGKLPQCWLSLLLLL